MECDPDKHRRRSIRLQGYDYSEPGAYFITLCAQHHRCLFGDVAEGEMIASDPGRMIQDVWNEMPEAYPGIETDAFQIMPNHVHGIVIIRATPDRGDVTAAVGATPCGCPSKGRAQRPAPTVLSLPDVVRRFRTMTTRRYVNGVRQYGWSPVAGRLWQRNYFERVIRNEKELDRIREYIMNNPIHWEWDKENPNARTDSKPSRPDPNETWAV